MKYICTIPWPKITTFAPDSETRMWYFRPGYDEKSYTQHGDKEASPSAPVTIYTCSGLSNSLPPLCVIYYLDLNYI